MISPMDKGAPEDTSGDKPGQDAKASRPMRLQNRMRAGKWELQAASIVRSITGLPRRTA